MSRNQDDEEIDVFGDKLGPIRGPLLTQPKRPDAPIFASESTLLKAMKGKPVSEASLRISMYAHRVNNGETEGWKADYRRIMGKWRKAGGGDVRSL